MLQIRSLTEDDTCTSQVFENGFDLCTRDDRALRCPVNGSCFESITVLGTGGYGKVVLVRKRSGPDSGQLYAMKILTKHDVLQKAKMVEHVLTERKVLEAVARSRFLVNLHYAFQSETKLHLVMDYVCGGELFTHLQRKRRFSENVVRFYMAEMILALGHLHALKIIYRDLKLENVMLDSRGHIVLTDFGLSKIFNFDDKVCRTFSFCGTIEYMAPEVINVPPRGYTFSVDWWSLGVLSYELISGKSPFAVGTEKNSHMDIADRVVNGKLPSFAGISPTLRDLLSKLMEKNPKRRIGSSGPVQICKHVFFQSVDWNNLYYQKTPAPVVPTVKCEADTRNFLKEFTKQPINDRPCPIPASGQLFLNFDYEVSLLLDGYSALFTSDRPRTNQMRPIMNSSPFFKKYDLLDERGYLGEGAHTICRRCMQRATGKHFAVKIVPVKYFRQEETENLSRLQNSPLVARFEEVLVDKSFAYVIMEALKGGDLLQRMYRDKSLRVKNAKHIISNVVAAVQFMHSCYVVHGNLRPEKVLLTGDDYTMSLRVVGYRNSQSTCADVNFQDRFGSHAAAAIAQCRKMLESIDFWAVGLIMYIIVYGRAPPMLHQEISTCLHFRNQVPCMDAANYDLCLEFDEIIMGLLATNWQIRCHAWDRLIKGEWLSPSMLVSRVELSPATLDFEECQRVKDVCATYLGNQGVLVSHLQPEVQSLISLPELQQRGGDNATILPMASTSGTADVTKLGKKRCRRKRLSLVKSTLKQARARVKKVKDVPPPAPSIHSMKLRSSARKRNARPPDNSQVVCLL